MATNSPGVDTSRVFRCAWTIPGCPPVAPALEFHPTTEAILSHFSAEIDVERIGLSIHWRTSLEVMFRLRGAERLA
jgi:hypothetical protein